MPKRASRPENNEAEVTVHFQLPMLTPLISLIAGIAILLFPRLLNYIVAAYLILAGVLGLMRGYGAP